MPLIQWILLNLEDAACHIEAGSILSGSAAATINASCEIIAGSEMLGTGVIAKQASCAIEAGSSCSGTATVHHRVRPQPAFENDRANLVGTYAILPNFGKKKYKYVHIDFIFNNAKYEKEFYTEKEISMAINEIKLNPPEVKKKINIAVNNFRVVSDKERIKELEVTVRSLRRKLRSARRTIAELKGEAINT